MDLSKFVVFDLEADGINPTKIYCLSVAYIKDGEVIVRSTTDYDEMRKLLTKENGIYVGHNIKNWDIPFAIEKILGITVKGFLIDTLYLSWYLYPEMKKHGLEFWGEYFDVPKPKITDWFNLTVEEYIHRCEEDVKINIRLFIKQLKYFRDLYVDKEEVIRFIRYLMFKADCVTNQLKSRWKIDINRCVETIERFKLEKENKVRELIEVMPKIPIIRVRKYPKQIYKKDGSLTVAGSEWFKLLKEKGLDEGYTQDIEYIHSYDQPNPNSVQQIKTWLYKLGWQPETFKYEKSEDGVRKVEQIRDGDKELCNSVKKLIKKEPKIEALNGLTVLSHRIGMLQGFLDNVSADGYIRAEIQGLTNTLRFKHKVAVNLPGVTNTGGIEDGVHIRGCLIADEGYELCGSDMSSLEDRTKQHFMWTYDPEYVKEMIVPDFDPHLSLALFAKAISDEGIDLYHKVKKIKKDNSRSTDNLIKISEQDIKTFEKITSIRYEYKTANYAAVYGTGAATLARSLGISETKARKILDAYWERNWSVKKVSENCKIKEVDGQKWLFNPISKFWYYLRHDKDKFSTLNQGSGVFCFDTWIKYIVSKGKWPIAQFHDEVILSVKKGYRTEVEKLLRWAIQKTNEELKLNRELDIDIQFGENYSEIH